MECSLLIILGEVIQLLYFFLEPAHQSCVSWFLQPIWAAIVNFDPQLFIWLGDNIYGDTKLPTQVFGKDSNIGPWKKKPRFLPVSSEVMEWKYNKAKNIPGYKELRQKSKVVVCLDLLQSMGEW